MQARELLARQEVGDQERERAMRQALDAERALHAALLEDLGEQLIGPGPEGLAMTLERGVYNPMNGEAHGAQAHVRIDGGHWILRSNATPQTDARRWRISGPYGDTRAVGSEGLRELLLRTIARDLGALSRDADRRFQQESQVAHAAAKRAEAERDESVALALIRAATDLRTDGWQWPRGKVAYFKRWEWQRGTHQDGTPDYERAWSLHETLDMGYIQICTGEAAVGRRVRVLPQIHRATVEDWPIAETAKLPPELREATRVVVRGVRHEWIDALGRYGYRLAHPEESIEVDGPERPVAWLRAALERDLPVGAVPLRLGSFVAVEAAQRP
jgi:hypothetical protein